ncbi:MAG: RNA polymerase sigma factor [Chitinophagales bacterium]
MALSLQEKYTIEELIAGCKKGKRTFQKGMYDQFSAKFFAICLRYGKDYAEAEDMLQEGFIKLFNKMDKYNNVGSFGAWASRLISNNCIDIIRKRPNLYTISDDYALDQKSPAPSALDNMIGEDLLLLVQSLPTGYRTIFNMYAIEGYSHKEIATRLEISEGTSKSQLNRARKLLQKKLIELENQENNLTQLEK